MTAHAPASASPTALRPTTALSWLLALAVVLAIVVLLRDSFLGMLYQWRSSSTFSYGFLIAPISLFLLWREQPRLMGVSPEPSWLAIMLMVPAGGLWVLGEVLEINLVHHFAAVMLLILAVWAVLGTRIARIIWFPLGYLLLMVPFGEFLVPTLMRWTADFAVLAVAATGVPVYQEGFVFSLPSGDFEVIKACSGIRFLMATVAAGIVFSWVAYSSWTKRLLFLAACLIVPVVGNLVRAWLVVMMVHLSDGRLAGDHVTYGTLFYAAILVGLFLVGARYADAPVKPDSPSPSLTAPRLMALPGVALAGSALASVLLVLATSAAPAALHSRMAGAGYAGLPPFPLSPDGYVGPSEAARDWQPSLRGPAGEHKARYQGGSGTRPVDVYVAIFDPARHTGELTESDNRVFDQRIWRQVAGQSRSGLDEAVLRPALGAPLPDGVSRFVWSWYVVNGEATNSRLQAKLLELKGMLSGRQAQQALIAFSTTFESSVNEEHSARARRDLMQFGRTYCAAAPLPCPALLGNQPQ